MTTQQTIQKENTKARLLFERCKAGTINTKLFRELTGRNVMIAGKKDYSNFSGKQLRAIRAKQALEAIEGQTHYLDGTPIDKSKIYDLCVKV